MFDGIWKLKESNTDAAKIKDQPSRINTRTQRYKDMTT